VRIIAIFFVLITAATSAGAQTLAEQMTCVQAKTYFAANGVVYVNVLGQVLPINRGIPLTEPLYCTGPNRDRFTYSTRTQDKRNCVISHYCG
jgi:hypothetical protein